MATDYSLAKKYTPKSNSFIDGFVTWNQNMLTGGQIAGGGFAQMHIDNLTPLNQIYAATAGTRMSVGAACYYGSGKYNFRMVFYDAETPSAIPYVVYLKMKTLSDYLSSLTSYTYFYDTFYDYPPAVYDSLDGEVFGNEMTRADFLTAYGDKKVITEIRLYDNTNDGEISENNQRTYNGHSVGDSNGIDLFFRFYGSGGYGVTADTDVQYPILLNHVLTKETGSITYNAQLECSRLAGNCTVLLGTTSQKTYGAAATSGLKVNIFDSQSDITDFMNQLGIPFSYDLTSITSANSDDFSDGYIPGFPGRGSETGGGTGAFDTSSDDIDFPSVPTVSAVNAGFITLYTPTLAQLNSLASYLWSSSFDLDTFKKLFADPMDVIIGLSVVPVEVPTAGSQAVKVGFVSTGVTMNLASSQYITVDCGTLTLSEFWGSALDYSPYTKFSIFLPYIGTRELKTDDIMNKTIQVKYNIDILSGSCTAMVKCGNAVLYEFSGACAAAVPVTGQNWAQLLTSSIQLAGAGIAVATTGGAAAGLLPSTANAVLSAKPNVQRTGAVTGSAGMLGVQQPYLIWELPRQSLAKNYSSFVGYPSNITSLLNDLTGYTQIESIHLENISATQNELAEIETLLKEGVII